ncbi:MAG TPA: peroxiredoxin [Thiobacillaceae bacterium]|nr:peroxiredoxin [Thiobacillaceae bacterium]
MKIALLILLVGALAVWIYLGLRPGHIPQPGQLAPEFQLPDQNKIMRSLADFSGRWRVLYFYPKDDTPGCTQEACRFRDDFAALSALGAVVIGISVDTPASHARFAGKYQLPFYLLADETGAATRAYGALMNFGLLRMARRYTFIIDPAGRIAKVYAAVDPASHSREVIGELRRLTEMRKKD